MKKEHAFRLAALSSAFGVGVALMVGAPAALAQQGTTPVVTKAVPASPVVQAQPVPASAPAVAATPLPAQVPADMAEAEEDGEEYGYEPLQVGDATQGLLAWQRSGELASRTARPIAGDVANRSYERYLKSFEFPIPERMTSSVKSSSGSGSGATAPR